MAHKTRVGGTAYEIKGGRTRVGGTGYSIGKGKTRVGGTAYSISFGVTWAKYSCEVTEVQYDYYKTTGNVGKVSTTTVGVSGTRDATVYTGYTFDSKTGFSGTGAQRVDITGWAGYYSVNSYQVRYYMSVSENRKEDPWTYYDVTSECIDECVGGDTITQYNKGSTSYGKIEVDEGVLPEQGTLVSGSATGNYCVIRINGTNYYYQKVA